MQRRCDNINMYTQWYRYIYVLSHKKNEIFPFAVTKMELESIM